ncbi:hypothetical protein HYALB_00007785 [Hymenoscyphus albidus]|uniref:Uncharacterized protein n=1 Tax=Hymenoscyphus albidus TaxID=595503 RepID=A0A9N9LRV6_9HELO|nr:hypothetical protein HYALB_00007785 [Hymenoscyphus albidus]
MDTRTSSFSTFFERVPPRPHTTPPKSTPTPSKPRPQMDTRTSSFSTFFERVADLTVNARNNKYEDPANTLRSLVLQQKELESQTRELEKRYAEAVEESQLTYRAYLAAGRGHSRQAAMVFNEAWRAKERLRRQIVRHGALLEGVRVDIAVLRERRE